MTNPAPRTLPERLDAAAQHDDDGQAFGRVLTGRLDQLAAAKNAEEEK